MNGDEIHKIIANFMPGAFWLAKYTPEWSTEDRISTLWIWAMENQHKYDPERGNLEQWLKGSSRRIIDVYRKEKGSRYYYEAQFPEFTNEKGEHISYEASIIDYREKELTYDIDEWELVEKSLGILSTDSRCILEQVVKYDSCKDSRGGEQGLADSLGISKVSLQSRRTLAKKQLRILVNDLKDNRKDCENGNGC
jgi:hypothetical protein